MVKRSIVALSAAGVAGLLAVAPSSGQQRPWRPLAFYDIPARGRPALDVSSPSFRYGGEIPVDDTQYGGNQFPGLQWTPGPSGTRSYVVLVQDGNVYYFGGPLLHFTLFNIPTGQTSLPEDMSAPPASSHYGPSFHSDTGPYLGPHPTPSQRHLYHFEVFALDEVLPQDISKIGFTGLRDAMSGHVLASGETVGSFAAPPS